jgi:hypothetical protein
MDGPQMIQSSSSRAPGIKVLLISGYSIEPIPPDLAQEFLPKPFLPAAIEKKVQKMLACDPALRGHLKTGQ